MTERPRADVCRSADSFAIGPSRAVWRNDALIIDIDERAAPAPLATRGRIVARPLMLTGRALRLDEAGRHVWRPVAPHCDVTVAFDAPGLAWRGGGYLDSNTGAEALEHGFSRWSWARAHRAEECFVSYDATPRAGRALSVCLRIDKDGAVHDEAIAPLQSLPSGLWGVRQSVRAASARVARVFEDTPFYTRGELSAGFGGVMGPAVYECLDLDRFAQSWVRALLPVRMPRRAAGRFSA